MPLDQYIIGSYQTSANTGNYNFEIRRIDGNGQYGTMGAPYYPITFFNGYNVFKGIGISTPPSYLMHYTHGISVNETGISISTPGINYAVAGTVSDAYTNSSGVFFTTLNVDGMGPNPIYWEFPTFTSNPSKPLLIEDYTNPGTYYICGSLLDASGKTMMYIIQTTATSPGPSNIFDSGNSLIPYDMVQSRLNSNELAIVGLNTPDVSSYPNRGIDGFFVKLDKSTLTDVPGSFQILGNGAEQYFTSIAPAKAPWPSSNPGFVIGGVSAPISGIGNSWMLKIDNSGSIAWNTLISGSSGTNQHVTGILERYNTTPGFEYYGATSTGMSQMTVFKLDDTGTLWTAAGGNEFEYTIGGGGPAFITTTSPGSGYGDGIQVFGTDVSGSTYDTYMVKAYYNGLSGCSSENINSISSQVNGPASPLNPPFNTNPGLNFYPGNDFYITPNFTPGDFSIVSVPCSMSSVPGGSNARMATGIIQNRATYESQIYPNPVSDNLVITLSAKSGGQVTMRLFNSLGQCVKTARENAISGLSNVTMDVRDLAAGVYSLKCELNGKNTQAKVVVTH